MGALKSAPAIYSYSCMSRNKYIYLIRCFKTPSSYYNLERGGMNLGGRKGTGLCEPVSGMLCQNFFSIETFLDVFSKLWCESIISYAC